MDGVDDVKEAQMHAEIDFGKFFFVSCWTQQEEESIPQWSMYSREMQGMRIEMPSYPFTDEPLRPKPDWEGMIWTGDLTGREVRAGLCRHWFEDHESLFLIHAGLLRQSKTA